MGLVLDPAPSSSSAIWCMVNCQVPGHVPRSRTISSLLDLGNAYLACVQTAGPSNKPRALEALAVLAPVRLVGCHLADVNGVRAWVREGVS